MHLNSTEIEYLVDITTTVNATVCKNLVHDILVDENYTSENQFVNPTILQPKPLRFTEINKILFGFYQRVGVQFTVRFVYNTIYFLLRIVATLLMVTEYG